jgi:hypothetical protein
MAACGDNQVMRPPGVTRAQTGWGWGRSKEFVRTFLCLVIRYTNLQTERTSREEPRGRSGDWRGTIVRDRGGWDLECVQEVGWQQVRSMTSPWTKQQS